MKQVLWDNHNILYLIVNKKIYYQSMAYFISHLMMSNEITSLKIILKKSFVGVRTKITHKIWLLKVCIMDTPEAAAYFL